MVKLARVCYSRKELRCAAISIRLTTIINVCRGCLARGLSFLLGIRRRRSAT